MTNSELPVAFSCSRASSVTDDARRHQLPVCGPAFDPQWGERVAQQGRQLVQRKVGDARDIEARVSHRQGGRLQAFSVAYGTDRSTQETGRALLHHRAFRGAKRLEYIFAHARECTHVAGRHFPA